MGAFSGRVSLDEDKYKEDSRPVLNCAVMYVPFEELFKAPTMLDGLLSRVAALEEDDEAVSLRLYPTPNEIY